MPDFLLDAVKWMIRETFGYFVLGSHRASIILISALAALVFFWLCDFHDVAPASQALRVVLFLLLFLGVWLAIVLYRRHRTSN